MDFVNRSQQDSLFWVVRISGMNEFIGLVSLEKYHDGEDIELSYQFLSKFWGKGLATEVIGALIQYSFDELKLNKIVAETQTANTRSFNLLERVGMTRIKNITRFGEEQAVYCIDR